MSLANDPEFFEHTYLRLNGYTAEEAHAMTPERRRATVECILRIKEHERSEIIKAIAKGLFG